MEQKHIIYFVWDWGRKYNRPQGRDRGTNKHDKHKMGKKTKPTVDCELTQLPSAHAHICCHFASIVLRFIMCYSPTSINNRMKWLSETWEPILITSWQNYLFSPFSSCKYLHKLRSDIQYPFAKRWDKTNQKNDLNESHKIHHKFFMIHKVSPPSSHPYQFKHDTYSFIYRLLCYSYSGGEN